ncbi:MAG: nucleoside triphosphate pyrophosphohydrolase [Clostridia bacterium]|nr:nucleoside triphosphate pyrophosphohydrolase [Clostridia bacterium]
MVKGNREIYEVTYNKLVRDNIPSIIEENNKSYTTHIADEDEYRAALLMKLNEETMEFISEPCVEELADILEVIDALKHTFKIEDDEVERVKSRKRTERGGFEKRIILETVYKK